MTNYLDAIVIGGGQAGLAAGYHLQKAGLDFTILEAGPQLGGSWPRYYDSLQLFSPARYSSLPGMPFPGDPDRYPRRDEVADYLRRYAHYFRLPVAVRSKVEAIKHRDGVFELRTDNGDAYRSRSVIAATGSFRSPKMPRLPGQQQFRGRILHSASYRNAELFAGKRVIVVGAANSAVQIAVELARVADVTLATRQPVKFVPQRIAGCDLHCWLRWSGMDWAPLLKDQSTPVLDAGDYRKALADGQPNQRSMFVGFTETGVRWTESETEPVDAVIFATGFRPSFPYLTSIGALDNEGRPRHRKGVSATTAGLYYVGLSGQRSFRSATLRGVGPDAAYVVRALRRRLRATITLTPLAKTAAA